MAELGFILASARWPALLVDDTGRIRSANDAAVEVFGAVVQGETPLLSSLWGPLNEITAGQFLLRQERSPVSHSLLHIKAKGGATVIFKAYLTAITQEGCKHQLLQFFPEAPVPPPPEPRAIADDGPAKSIEASLALRQKLECAMQLIRSVVLDFNNALTSILGHTSLLLSKAEANHPWRIALLEVEKAAERAAEITHHLAAFSRSAKETHALADGNLNQLLRSTVELCQAPPAVPVSWSLHLENQLFAAQFDEVKMQQAFLKILDNSLQATGPQGAITIRSRNLELKAPLVDGAAALTAGNYVCLEFSDNGPGIPPQALPRIFEPFFTTKPNHRGLGLAWVYGIVTNHGGRVTVASPPGQGTTVRIYLPATKRFIQDQNLSDAGLAGTQTILVVDDESAILTMIQTVLTECGYKVYTAPGGEEALALLARDRPKVDLVITDLVMPRLGGRELIGRLRRLMPGIRILCCSGCVRPQGDSESEAYLQKPFTSQQLLFKVKQVIA